MNTPGIVLNMPSLTERDIAYLDTVSPEHVDFVGLSFVRSREDIQILREALDSRGFHAQIVAKIENQKAVDNLDEVITAADAVMVARGDLGVEVPFQELIHWQKSIIEKARSQAKPVITATEMLKSMIDKPRPTRAEVSDVAHAIYDGTDAVMLSEETTIGKFPVKVVETQASIAAYNEPHAQIPSPQLSATDTQVAVVTAAIGLVKEGSVHLDKIICLTETGKTAQLLASFRPSVPVIALARDIHTYYKLSLSYGVTPYLLSAKHNQLHNDPELLKTCQDLGVVSAGETVLILHGEYTRKSGQTNTVSIFSV